VVVAAADRIQVVEANVTKEEVDAIVNAARSRTAAGVAGAISSTSTALDCAPEPGLVRFCLFGDRELAAFERALGDAVEVRGRAGYHAGAEP
jgi:O-acetyl-ADP-ribose deacetylase (regulator of RNase III)